MLSAIRIIVQAVCIAQILRTGRTQRAVLSPEPEEVLANLTTDKQAQFDLDGLIQQLYSSELLPEPFALFPFVDNQVNSEDSKFTGSSGNVIWVQDDRFGLVPFCDQDDLTHVITLKSVPYYVTGKFAVNFWFKAHNISGEHFQYMFSHTSQSIQDRVYDLNYNMGWSQNQFNIFIPEYDHFSHGILRVLLKDDNDVYQGRRSMTWVDSDGQVGINTGVRLESIDPADGRWHMVTVTTQPTDLRGYQLYLDGKLSGEIKEGNRYIGPGSDVLDINGGDQIVLDGDIVMCGSATRNPERDFHGSISYLSLFNTSLTAEQIAYMYQLYGGDDLSHVSTLPDTRPDRLPNSPGASRTEPTITFGPNTITGDTCAFPFEYNDQTYDECVMVNDAHFCMIANGSMVTCVANAVFPTSTPLPDDHPRRHDGRETVNGSQCKFPSMNNDIMVYDCILREGVEKCQTEAGVWEECVARDDDSAQLADLQYPTALNPFKAEFEVVGVADSQSKLP
eukprot:TRINITY_DN2302_c0_g1_i1.p1 TRINITY_DN2302_c0_g1~~TRINITY_DN2302_c0_g1_i1.p1  ORF type:complete len:506 (-),score=35.69 TRINITY_DN2302_c0_g1_i1:694-2211(-)